MVLDESATWSKDWQWAAAHVMSPPIRKHKVDGVARSSRHDPIRRSLGYRATSDESPA